MATETQTQITSAAYERLALDEPDRKWELLEGHLREKPGMTAGHNHLAARLGYLLMSQLDWSAYDVRVEAGRVHRPEATYFIPDIMVIPTAFVAPLLAQHDVLEVYDQPLPLVVEVWSRSTGNYDTEAKIPEYQRRGDLEIWRIHPYERTLTAWVRQPNGSYVNTIYCDGDVVRPSALPGVAIDLSDLFEQ